MSIWHMQQWCSLRLVILTGFCSFVLGLIVPTTGRSADLAVDQRTSREPATTLAAEAGQPATDDSLSYLLTPFKLASQPNLKQSVFGLPNDARPKSASIKFVSPSET
jgi:hypothetical protein